MKLEQLQQEAILQAWLRLSCVISNERLVTDLPYNESLVYHILYGHEKTDKEVYLTATDLCRETKMAKSLMNRTLNQMEEKELIVRERSKEDKRQVFVKLNLKNVEIYEAQHEKMLQIVRKIAEQIGEEKAGQALEIFVEVAKAAEEVLE